MNHSPLPWTCSSKGISHRICDANAERYVLETCEQCCDPVDYKNIEFIVKACNSHYELLEACKAIAFASTQGSKMNAVSLAMKAISKAESL